MHTLPVRRFWFPALLILIGAVMLLERFHVLWIGWPAILWTLVTVGGGVKLYNGLVLKSRGGVFWGLFWFVLGGACLLRSCGIVWLDPGIVVSGLFLVFGAGLFLVFLVAPRSWHVLVPAACFLLVGGAILSTELGYWETWEVAPVVSRWWPVGLVLFGAALLINHNGHNGQNWRNRPDASPPPQE
jgi:hypothetical protein